MTGTTRKTAGKCVRPLEIKGDDGQLVGHWTFGCARGNKRSSKFLFPEVEHFTHSAYNPLYRCFTSFIRSFPVSCRASKLQRFLFLISLLIILKARRLV